MIKVIIPPRRANDRKCKTVVLEPRGIDSYGSGAFGAKRGSRKHNGIDFKAPAGASLLSPVAGEVSKLGYPYADDLSYRYVEITTKCGRQHRLFYVEPTVLIGEKIAVGESIGLVQDIAARYNEYLMTNHVHYEIKTGLGEFINPANLD